MQSAPRTVSTGLWDLPEHWAALLSYLAGWVTGIIFFVLDKRAFVRFHAAQSIVVFGSLTVVEVLLALARIPLLGFLDFVGLLLWVALMWKAYCSERFKLPVAGKIAEDLCARAQ